MATISTKKILYGSTSLIPTIANSVKEEFQNDSCEVAIRRYYPKGGVFKATLRMKQY